ncbi:MAG: DciA family protein [Paracoccaceae bacterium]|nr:DciA family protein [Paracoccaceae bacterium]MDE2914784.1 DciA family protein [Paracoccaceae bacterium]
MPKPEAPRPRPNLIRRSGFVQIGTVLNAEFRRILGKRGIAEARLISRWPEIVGEAFAQHTCPLRITRPRKGGKATLVVLIDRARGPMLDMLKPEIVRRVNACFGYAAIGHIRLTQTSPAMPEVRRRSRPPVVPDSADPGSGPSRPRLPGDVRQTIDSIRDPDLRQALTSLGRSVRKAQLTNNARPDETLIPSADRPPTKGTLE